MTATIDARGVVWASTASKANVPGVNVTSTSPKPSTTSRKTFWDFLNQTGPVVQVPANITATGTVTEYSHDRQPYGGQRHLDQPWFYASGLPISEPYWTRATITGRSPM